MGRSAASFFLDDPTHRGRRCWPRACSRGEVQRFGSSVAFSEALLDFRTSSVRRQSARPGNFKRIEWLPLGIFKVAGVLPWNLSSTKISAPSGSDEIVTVPTPSGAGGEARVDGWGELPVSVSVGWLEVAAVLCFAAATFG